MKLLLQLIILLFIFACNNRSTNKLSTDSVSYLKFNDASHFLTGWPDKNVVIVHSISDPDNLHPTNGNSAPRSEIFQYTQRPLLYIDYKNQKISPGLVKSLPDISSDGLRYTYKLRDNISWDDGSPLTAQDIIFTAKAFKCPLTEDPAVKSYWMNVIDIIPVNNDSLSFTIVMAKKHIQNISFLTGFSILQKNFFDPSGILSKFSLAQFGDTSFHAESYPELSAWASVFNSDDYGRNPEKLDGLGMYKVQQWIPGEYITLIKKNNHWTENSDDDHEISYPEKIIFKINKDEASQLLDFKNELLDASTNISSSTLIKLSTTEGIPDNYNLAMIPTYNFTYVAFNEKPDGEHRKKMFDDVSVRKAVSHLIPVDKLISLVYGPFSGSCKKMSGNVSPLKDEHDSNLKPCEFNITEAQSLLKNAGWTDSDNDGILDKMIDGNKVSLSADLFYLSTASEWKDMALLIREECAKAGININPSPLELKLFLEKARSHDFDLLLGAFGASSLPEDYSQLYHTSSWLNHGSNYTGFGDSQTDSLIEEINSELDTGKHNELSKKLQRKINDDLPFVYLYSSMRRNIIHKRFGNQVLFSERPGILYNMLKLINSNGNGVPQTSP